MAIMIKAGEASAEGYFNLKGVDYQKGAGLITGSGDAIGINNAYTNEVLQPPTNYANWVNDSGTPYASVDALKADLYAVGVFKLGGGTGDGGADGLNVITSFTPVKELKSWMNKLVVTENADEIALNGGVEFLEIDSVSDLSARLPKIVPADGIQINSQTDSLILEGGQGSIYELVALNAEMTNYQLVTNDPYSFDTVSAGAVASMSIFSGGVYVSNGSYAFTQSVSSGNGTGVEGQVTISGSEVTAIPSITNGGSGYNVGETVTISVPGSNPIIDAILTIDSVV